MIQELAALKTIFWVKGLWCTGLLVHNSQCYETGAHCSYVNVKTMNVISSDAKITKKIVFYSRKNDFIEIFKICLSMNKRIEKTEMT